MRRANLPAIDLGRLADLDTMSLRCKWAEFFKLEPSPRISRDLLIRAIAWQLQEAAYGGFGASVRRQLARLAAELQSSGSMPVSASIAYKPGTRLVREWLGKTHEVIILDEGYLWSGKRYKSLSVIARSITGTRWSGPRFFGTENTKRAASTARPSLERSKQVSRHG